MIAREGVPFVGAAFLVAVAGGILFGAAGWALLVLPLAVAGFFRDPGREIPSDPDLLVAPADGKIVALCDVDEFRTLKQRVKKVSIFLSIFDVHINRIPCGGWVKEVCYNRGKFVAAFRHKASADNEQNVVLLQEEGGREILLVQIAGLIARRIVCYLKAGDAVARGQRFGMIRFGSRVDLYLPRDVSIQVKVGDHVRGGETVIGRLR